MKLVKVQEEQVKSLEDWLTSIEKLIVNAKSIPLGNSQEKAQAQVLEHKVNSNSLNCICTQIFNFAVYQSELCPLCTATSRFGG